MKFQSQYHLLNYTHWSDLNTMYFSQVTQLILDTKRSIHNDVSCISDIHCNLMLIPFLQIRSINHDRNEAVIDIPEGRYSQSKIQKIHNVRILLKEIFLLQKLFRNIKVFQEWYLFMCVLPLLKYRFFFHRVAN